MTKKRILFVDDEQLVLQGLQRMLRGQRNEWAMEFVETGAEALLRMEKDGYDVIVSDMRMPGMNGAQLMARVMQRHPNTVRIILSGHADKDLIMQCVSTTHQYLSKPCEPEALKAVVHRATQLDALIRHERLKKLIGQMEQVPSIPSLYSQMLELLHQPEASVAEVGTLVAKDIGMTAQILKIVNSAFFGLRRQVSDPVEAVSHLGLDTIKSLVLAIGAFSQFRSAGPTAPVIEHVWTHSMEVAACAKAIAGYESAGQALADSSFVAGLLHDVGKLVLAANFPREYTRAQALVAETGVIERQAEIEVFGSSHPEIGGYLLGLWGLPVPIVEAIALHHEPHLCSHTTFSPLTAVHVANLLVRHKGKNAPDQIQALGLDGDYLNRLGLLDRVTAWSAAWQDP